MRKADLSGNQISCFRAYTEFSEEALDPGAISMTETITSFIRFFVPISSGFELYCQELKD